MIIGAVKPSDRPTLEEFQANCGKVSIQLQAKLVDSKDFVFKGKCENNHLLASRYQYPSIDKDYVRKYICITDIFGESDTSPKNLLVSRSHSNPHAMDGPRPFQSHQPMSFMSLLVQSERMAKLWGHLSKLGVKLILTSSKKMHQSTQSLAVMNDIFVVSPYYRIRVMLHSFRLTLPLIR
jgi:hypothetical protein